jgi:hypothetical protein
MADRDLRKAELERKKAKLAEMRKEKQRKEVNEKLASKKANWASLTLANDLFSEDLRNRTLFANFSAAFLGYKKH